MDVARFGAFATPKYTAHQGAGELSRGASGSPIPNEELPAARPVRRSPVYDRLKAAGAVMGANFGLEHALWFAPEGVDAGRGRRPIAVPRLSPSCAPSARRCARRVGIYETTNYGKYEMTGARRARRGSTASSPAASRSPGAWRSRRCSTSAGRIVGRPLDRLPRARTAISSWAPASRKNSTCAGSGRPSRRPTYSCAPPLRRWPAFRSPGPNARELLQRLVARRLERRRFKLFRRARDRGRLRAGDPHARRLHRRARLRNLGRRPTISATLYEEHLATRARTSASRISAAARSPRCGSRKATARSTRISARITRPAKPGSTLRRLRQADFTAAPPCSRSGARAGRKRFVAHGGRSAACRSGRL